ncbi:hypothetical protein B0H13DRAFT_2373668 [Mycena leptocephala]|nr:hypothetical protein B0H13DRAFT_2373668 [Mycena leptocephala]
MEPGFSIVFSDVSTVHPDYRAHKPVLRASTSRTIAHECRPLLFFFLNVIATLVSFASSPCTLQAIKLIALNTTVDTITVASRLGVYLFEVSVLFICIIHRLYPEFLPLHRSFMATTSISPHPHIPSARHRAILLNTLDAHDPHTHAVVQPEINSSVSPIIACAQGLFHTLLDMDMRGNNTGKIDKEMYALAVRIEPILATPELFQQLSVPSSVVSILRSGRLLCASRTPRSVSIGLAHAAQTVMSSAATVEKNRDGWLTDQWRKGLHALGMGLAAMHLYMYSSRGLCAAPPTYSVRLRAHCLLVSGLCSPLGLALAFALPQSPL